MSVTFLDLSSLRPQNCGDVTGAGVLGSVAFVRVTKHARVPALPRASRGCWTENLRRHREGRTYWDVRGWIQSGADIEELHGGYVSTLLEPAVREAFCTTGRS